MLNAFIFLLYRILELYSFAVIVYIILGWLIFFNIVNRSQRLVSIIYEVLSRLIDPVLVYLRRVIPPIGGLDLSPIFLFLLIYFLQDMLVALTYG